VFLLLNKTLGELYYFSSDMPAEFELKARENLYATCRGGVRRTCIMHACGLYACGCIEATLLVLIYMRQGRCSIYAWNSCRTRYVGSWPGGGALVSCFFFSSLGPMMCSSRTLDEACMAGGMIFVA
jgi:hypothetical protein